MRLSRESLANLRDSGLSDTTIESAKIADHQDPLVAELLLKFGVTKGYRIPYPPMNGATPAAPFFRIRVLEPVDKPKYAQPSKSTNHVYLPPGLPGKWWKDTTVPLIITEGEKKALAGTQAGLPTLGLGGIESWHARKLTFDHAVTVVELGPKVERFIKEQVCPELLETDWKGRVVQICYDTDVPPNPNVQMAAFSFALWLETQGAIVSQVALPASGAKVGLDDFLKTGGSFQDLDVGFPLPPRPKEWITEQLSQPRAPRSTPLRVARATIAALDAWGRRYKDDVGNFYYFDTETHLLHEFRLDQLPRLRETSFGMLLSNELGMGTADTTTMSRVADSYATFGDIEHVEPHRAIARHDDAIYYQLNDAQMVRVDKDEITVLPNGEDNVLFLRSVVEPIEEETLLEALKTDLPALPRWLVALSSLNLEPFAGMGAEETHQLLATLFYLSPWLNRWRGLLLPMEVAVAEPNSGKTFLYNLRKGVLTGRPELGGMPDEYRSWVSAASAAPGMWVCDNLGSVRSDYWHRLTDDLARLITDPRPSVELRQLYTTASVHRVPIDVTFAATTIKNPFTAPDILQRTLVYNLKAIPAGKRDSRWYTRRLAERPLWVAEHLLAIQDFLVAADKQWDDEYVSGHRLPHFEQALLRMGEALGFDLSSAVKALPGMVSASVAEYDPVIEALATFVAEWPSKTATMTDIVEWAELDVDHRFNSIKTLGNSILLGRYFASHEYDIKQSTGIERRQYGTRTVLAIGTTGEPSEEGPLSGEEEA